jgi:uncharacterized protein DUF2017
MENRRFEPTAEGRIHLKLPADERAVLWDLAESMQELVSEDDDPALRRLFPPAHEDPELEREYRELTRGQLEAGYKDALRLWKTTLDSDLLSPDEADAWLRALNAVRLVLGTGLDISEDLDWDAVTPDDPHATELAVYAYVSWIQEQLVEATAFLGNTR